MRLFGAGARNLARSYKWHMDQVFIQIQGVPRYLWRVVDQDGVVLDILVQEHRDARTAKRFFMRLPSIATSIHAVISWQPMLIVQAGPGI